MEKNLNKRIASLTLEQREQLVKRLNPQNENPGTTRKHDKYLCAYITVQPGQTLDETELRNYLSEKLPAFMIPSYFMILPELPLTARGKVDLKALARLDSPGAQTGAEATYMGPQNNVQEIILGVWQEVLNVEKVGIDDSFFEIGGNSLKLLRLNNRLKEALRRDIPIMKMFEHPTIRSMWAYVSDDPAAANGPQGRAGHPQNPNQAKQNRMKQRQKRMGTGK